MKNLRAILVSLLVFGPFAPPTGAQEAPPSQDPGVLRLYLDCQGSGCRDLDFYRTEIQFVNWVRERQDAEVHLLITSQVTGSGGRSSELLFMGQERFAEMVDTLHYVSGFDATTDEQRRGLVGIMKIGLMRFVGLTPLAERIDISLQAPPVGGVLEGKAASASVASPKDDPWNFWVFSVSTSGFWFGESTYSTGSLNYSASANRITDDWKATFRIRGSLSRQEIDLVDRTEVNQQESYYANGLLVRSLGPHWSVGVRGSASRVTRLNQQLAARVAPVLEYNLFPYSESTRRQLTFQYSLGTVHYDYEVETIFDQTRETRFDQGLNISLNLKEPWGSAGAYVSGAHYLHNTDLHNLTVGGNLSLRLFRGFRFNLGGSYSRIRDQLYVIKGDLSDEDILLRRRALLTDYFTSFSMGISYSFGSIFNNVVNPRIGGSGGGGGMMIMY